METKFNVDRRRSSSNSIFSHLTVDSGISVTSGFPYSSNVNPEVFVSKATGNGYPIVQSNGCKKFGPPLNYDGPEPGPECELFVKHFPREFLECHLIPHFERFGEIYEFRMMMDYDNKNRGYAYVRFLKEESAVTACEVMKYFLLPNGNTLQVLKSYNKCRLFVSNLPSDVAQEKIILIFQNLFPKMTNMTIYPSDHTNRAFAFLDFTDHAAALEAKISTSPGCLDLFGREVKVAWAHPDRQTNTAAENEKKTLFIRKIGLSVTPMQLKTFLSQTVPMKAIKSISPVRDFAFVEFCDHATAQKVKEKLNGVPITNTPIEIEWARPPSENSIHNLKQTDFDHKLRLICLANYYEMPIYLYGRVYQGIAVQNASITIKSAKQTHHYFFEIFYEGLVDIQSRIAEVIIHMVETFGHLPKEHLVIKVHEDFFHVVGFMQNMKESPVFHPASKFLDKQIFFEEILDLALMANVFENINIYDLHVMYQSRTQEAGKEECIENININGRILGCLHPGVRPSTTPIPPGFPNREMMFVLLCAFFKNNVNFFNKAPNQYQLRFFNNNGVIQGHHYIISSYILPLRFLQSKRHSGQICGFVTFGNIMPRYPQQQRIPQWVWTQPPPLAAVYHPVALSPTHSMLGVPLPIPSNLRGAHSNMF